MWHTSSILWHYSSEHKKKKSDEICQSKSSINFKRKGLNAYIQKEYRHKKIWILKKGQKDLTEIKEWGKE